MFFSLVKEVKNWPVHYLAKWTKPRKVTYRMRDGTNIETRGGTMDKSVLKDVLIKKVYGPAGFEIQPSDTVVDIGAHIGVFSVWAAKQAKKVFSFEPETENHKMLQQNLALNGLNNVTVTNTAVSADGKPAVFFISRQNTGGHSFHFAEENSIRKEIPTVAFAKFINDNGISQIDYLKLDCEGAEFSILFGLDDDTFKRIKKIAMECHETDSENTIAKMRSFLESKGKKVTIRDQDNPKICMMYAR